MNQVISGGGHLLMYASLDDINRSTESLQPLGTSGILTGMLVIFSIFMFLAFCIAAAQK